MFRVEKSMVYINDYGKLSHRIKNSGDLTCTSKKPLALSTERTG